VLDSPKPGYLSLTLLTRTTPPYTCAGTGKGVVLGVSLNAGLFAYGDWADLLDVPPSEDGTLGCRWVLGTRRGNVVITFYAGKKVVGVAWAPYMGEVYAKGECEWR
jgi:hypothetical protein